MIRQHELEIATKGRGIYSLSSDIEEFVQSCGVRSGICHVFIRHTSASLMLSENADPDVLRDLETFMSRQVPDGDPMFRHTQSDLNIPIRDGKCALGTWQGVFLWEHRHAPHRRHVLVTVHGE